MIIQLDEVWNVFFSFKGGGGGGSKANFLGGSILCFGHRRWLYS